MHQADKPTAMKARAYATEMFGCNAPILDVIASLRHTYGYGLIEAKEIAAAAKFDTEYEWAVKDIYDPGVRVALRVLKDRVDAISK